MKAVEAAKNRHISTLVSAHARAFGDIKLYFNEITHSNLDLIKVLKEEVCAVMQSHLLQNESKPRMTLGR